MISCRLNKSPYSLAKPLKKPCFHSTSRLSPKKKKNTAPLNCRLTKIITTSLRYELTKSPQCPSKPMINEKPTQHH